ncbi:SixA phosphatase family protein [Negadavirga shengliensis]|uniref:SixA phosphatase family protein n=1 Tax=Negadavirga shengliensis TaxID=1389218 RepID=A0ABV9SYM2_9BACT
MKRLLICRHAKSAWDNPLLSDQRRPLAARGLRDAPKMAKRLKKKGIFPDHILSSNAVRAFETAKIMAKEIGYETSRIETSRELYLASANAILKQIRVMPDHINTLFIFGHNPGFNDLIETLGGDIFNLPTSGQFGFRFAVNSWASIGRENAEEWFFDYPKNKED